jgi:hypothetical protein
VRAVVPVEWPYCFGDASIQLTHFWPNSKCHSDW